MLVSLVFAGWPPDNDGRLMSDLLVVSIDLYHEAARRNADLGVHAGSLERLFQIQGLRRALRRIPDNTSTFPANPRSSMARFNMKSRDSYS